MSPRPRKRDQPPTPEPPRDDPRPVAPIPPDDDACCHSGCDPCVFDMYADELERYREELRAWEERRQKDDKRTR